MHYGGDYNPEEWPRETCAEDVVRMKEAGVARVTVGVFSWSHLQPAEGEFDFEWLDTVIDLLHDQGNDVDPATAKASPPPLFNERYPHALPRTADGVQLGPGSRQRFAPTSPAHRRLVTELVTRLVERYAQHPAVVLWHVNNEYGCHVTADHSDSARVAFRAWLERRYGSVDALDAAWGTAFWSQCYTSYTQVGVPRPAPYNHNPTRLLDFKRFTSNALLECYLMERDIIKAAGATQPVTTNFMGALEALGYWAWAEHVDVISDDAYPEPQDPEGYLAAALQPDLMRSLKPGASCAVILDWAARWSADGRNLPVELPYERHFSEWHASLHHLGVATDFVRSLDDLDGFDVVTAPHLAVLTITAGENLAAFVARGGSLIVGAFSDVVDENDHFREGSFLTLLGPTLGVDIEDFGALPLAPAAGSTAEVTVDGEPLFHGEFVAERLRIRDAEVIATFADGAPAVTRRRRDRGSAIHHATAPDAAGRRCILAAALAEAGIVVCDADGVEVTDRGEHRFVINQTAYARTAEGLDPAPFEYRTLVR